MTPIAFRIEPKLDDYVHGMRLYDSKEIMSPRAMIAGAVYCGGLSVLAFFSWDRQWPYLLLGPIVFIIIRLAIFSARKPQGRAIFRSKIARGPSDVTFDENGMVAVSADARSEIKWSAFQRVIESDKVFLLVYSKYGYVTIPTRVFDSSAQVDEFRTLIESKIGHEPR